MVENTGDQTVKNHIRNISFSPRRLAASYYCGRLGNHLRRRDGSPRSVGMDFGTRVDDIVTNFYKYGTYVKCRELDYIIMNTPANREVETQTLLTKTYHDSKSLTNFTIGGVSDLIFPEYGVEVKTGKEKEWHYIQALSYATITDKEWKLLYITQEFMKTVKPNDIELVDMMRTAVEHEEQEYTKKSSHCDGCGAKIGCPMWSAWTPLAEATGGLRALTQENSPLDAEEKGHIEKAFEYVKYLMTKYVTEKITFNNGHTNISAYQKDGWKLGEIPLVPFPNVKKAKPTDEQVERTYLRFGEKKADNSLEIIE